MSAAFVDFFHFCSGITAPWRAPLADTLASPLVEPDDRLPPLVSLRLHLWETLMATGLVLARYQAGSSASLTRAPDVAGPLTTWLAAPALVDADPAEAVRPAREPAARQRLPRAPKRR